MMSMKPWLSRGAALLLWICAASGFAAGASGPQYVVTNDDVAPFFPSGVSFYTVGAGGLLTLKEQVETGGSGIGGGYFAANRVTVLDNGSTQCVFASDASTGDIVGISVSTLELAGSASGSPTDTGTTNGIGLAMNTQYLYASFTDSSTIGTFQVQPGCSLSFVNDVTVSGLQGGIISAMAIHGNMLIATYNDGSIESFNISSGTPVSNGDEQNTVGYLKSQGASYPNGIDITKDGHFAIFGDSNLMLSPDETLLYISNTQGDRITAAFFDASTGKLSAGCTSGKLKSYGTSWSYVASLGFETTTGTGGVLYVAEFGAASSIGMIQVTSAGGVCTLTELPSSPVADPNSAGLLSIATFPPRGF
jgi:hypothetical protein